MCYLTTLARAASTWPWPLHHFIFKPACCVPLADQPPARCSRSNCHKCLLVCIFTPAQWVDQPATKLRTFIRILRHHQINQLLPPCLIPCSAVCIPLLFGLCITQPLCLRLTASFRVAATCPSLAVSALPLWPSPSSIVSALPASAPGVTASFRRCPPACSAPGQRWGCCPPSAAPFAGMHLGEVFVHNLLQGSIAFDVKHSTASVPYCWRASGTSPHRRSPAGLGLAKLPEYLAATPVQTTLPLKGCSPAEPFRPCSRTHC